MRKICAQAKVRLVDFKNKIVGFNLKCVVSTPTSKPDIHDVTGVVFHEEQGMDDAICTLTTKTMSIDLTPSSIIGGQWQGQWSFACHGRNHERIYLDLLPVSGPHV
ncbi:hypothetical protein KXJ72_17990 (plasmid) [Comamonas aquatica]|nr:hypothetical protein KXJ72_17990 [Comamonas aquatica]